MRVLMLMLLLIGVSTEVFAANTKTPIGYWEFCNRSTDFCTADKAIKKEAPPIGYTKKVKRILEEVNTRWNNQITAITDQELYNKREYWAGATKLGDCEEYVIAKKRELLARGYSASQLLYAIVRDQNNDAHLVLLVRTTQGIFVLDNLRTEILRFEDTGYPLQSYQRPDAPFFWQNDSIATASAR